VNEIRKEYLTEPIGLVADVTSLEDVQDLVCKTVERCTRIDILVNNAGYPIRDDFWEASSGKIDDQGLLSVLEVDTLGTFRCCRQVMPIMVGQHQGY
jgi:NADP-dependent 3-hydroxy acid dehydrogenase YdfG